MNMDKLVDRVSDFYSWALHFRTPFWVGFLILILTGIVGLFLLFVVVVLTVLNPTISALIFAYLSWLLFKKIKRMYQESRK